MSLTTAWHIVDIGIAFYVVLALGFIAFCIWEMWNVRPPKPPTRSGHGFTGNE